MKILSLACLLSCFLATNAFALRDKVIYGEDNRVDVYASTVPLYVDLASSTAAMIPNYSLSDSGNGTYRVDGTPMRSRGMCATERFIEQPTVANCSGFLVGPDLLVTAGHCVRSQNDCSRYRWVFDFKMDSETEINMNIPSENIYACKQLITTVLDSNTSDDYALIQLDRVAKDRTPLEYRREGAVEVGDPLVVIGHPTGLPTKIADGASVRSINNPYYFVANLDTYGGNSGSAVFNAETGVVEGILVRGEVDYVYSGNCRVSKICTSEGCRGEDVTRITNIKQLMDR